MNSGISTAITRRYFLAAVLASTATGLTACSSNGSKGGYDDGYSAGFAAGYEAGRSAKEDAGKDDDITSDGIPQSGIEYTIDSVSRGDVEYSLNGTGIAIVLNVTAKNVSDDVVQAFFIDRIMNVYQDGKALAGTTSVVGYDYYGGTELKPGATLDGWVAYELLDETIPIEIEAGTINTSDGKTPYYGLANPQTVDPTTL